MNSSTGGRSRHVGLEQAVPPAAQGDELADEGRVPVGLLPTQLVVVVGGGQCKGDLPAQSVQLVEQAHGVRSAGYGAQDGACLLYTSDAADE